MLNKSIVLKNFTSKCFLTLTTYSFLYSRLHALKKMSKQVKEAMEDIKKQMGTIKNNSDTKLKQGLKTLRENMKILRSRILVVQAKLNIASESSSYSQEERERLNRLYEEATQPQKVSGKVEEVKGKLEELLEKKNSFSTPTVPSEAFNNMSNEEKRRVITILKEQTKGIYSLVNMTKKNAYKLDVVDQIVQEVKKEKAREAAITDMYMY